MLSSAVVKADNNYNILVDEQVVSSGSLLEDFTSVLKCVFMIGSYWHNYRPPVNPPKEIDDPEDKKPSDWDEREK